MTHIKKFIVKRKMIWLTALLMTFMMVGIVSYLPAADEKKEEPGEGYLGVNIEKIAPEDQKEFGVSFGVLVIRVIKGEAAEKAGIKKYDVIQYVNGEKIRRPEDLSDVIHALKPGSEAKIKFVRDGKETEIPVIIGEFKPEKDLKFLPMLEKEFKQFRIKPHGAFLGVSLQSLDNKDLAEYFGVKADGGALVIKIDEDSPAEKAGFKAGDVIIQIHGKDVAAPEDAQKILEELQEGDKIEIQIIRQKNKMKLNAELDEAKSFHGPSHFFNFNKGFEIPFESHTPDGHAGCMLAPGDEEKIIERRELALKRKEMDKKRKELNLKREEIEKEIEEKMAEAGKKIKKVMVKIKDNTYI